MTTSVLDQWGAHLGHSRGASAHTVRAYTADLAAFLAFTGTDPADAAAALASARADQRLPRVVDQDEAAALLECARSRASADDPVSVRDWAILELIYATGIRVSEACSLTTSSIDPAALTVRVLGKGDKERTVPFGVPARDALDQWTVRADRPPRRARDDPQDVRQGRGARHRPPRVAPQRRHAPAAGRSGPAGGPGDPGALLARDDPAVHARGRGQAQRRGS